MCKSVPSCFSYKNFILELTPIKWYGSCCIFTTLFYNVQYISLCWMRVGIPWTWELLKTRNMKNEKILWHINSKICINESYFVCACVFILFLGASQTEQNVKTIETTFFLNICDCKRRGLRAIRQLMLAKEQMKSHKQVTSQTQCQWSQKKVQIGIVGTSTTNPRKWKCR